VIVNVPKVGSGAEVQEERLTIPANISKRLTNRIFVFIGENY
jgi:hypothetical protein